MRKHLLIITFLASCVTLLAEPAKEVKKFEADTDQMSQEEVRSYMGRGPDEAVTPHLWRYRGSWTNPDTMEDFNTVDLSFGMKTDSHKYGVVGFYWDNK